MTESNRELRKKERLDYALFHNEGKKRTKEDSVSSEVFRSVSGSITLSADSDSEAETSFNTPGDYTQVDDAFNNQLTDLSLRLEGIEVEEITMAEGVKLRNLEETLCEDIQDYIDENQYDDKSAIADIDASISKVEELRTKYRSVHKDLKSFDDGAYDGQFKAEYDKNIKLMKDYLASVKAMKGVIRDNESFANARMVDDHQAEIRGERQRKQETSEFLIADVGRVMDLLLKETALFLDTSDVTDEELWEAKKKLPILQKQTESMCDKYKELLEIVPDSVPQKDRKLNELSDKYKSLLSADRDFRERLDAEMKKRELTKEKSFETSTLKINLPRFSGYDCKIDVYTFQEKFEKVHKAKTPKRLMPELLKNNYLEGSALEYVKRHEDIDEIWKSLKQAFGDPRMMMLRKVQELEAIPPLWRVKDSEKAKESLSKIVNLIDELMKLSVVHKIEDNLYYGDAIYSIYKVIGDHRVSKFLEKTYEDELKGKDLWIGLVKYLEKEIKIYTEKAMIHRNLEQKNLKDNDRDKDKENKHKDPKAGRIHQSSTSSVGGTYGGGSGNLNPDGNDKSLSNGGDRNGKTNKRDQTNCSLCGKADHVTTKGPYGMKLIQYFSCEKFTSSSPGERFNYLKSKGLCTQCLFPGARSSTGKHVDGTCQSVYTCKHPAHNSSPIKKHILVCEEHKNSEESKTLLEEYRSKCINRPNNINLPDFAKQIQLSFHTGVYSGEAHASLVNEETDDVGIYMMQQIVVGKEKYTTFFDSGCGDMVASIKAINRLGKRAKKLYDGPIPLGGIGDIVIESPHGIYEVNMPLYNGHTAKMKGIALDDVTNEFPEYVLNTQIESDIRTAYQSQGGDIKKLPRLPRSVGGKVDLMIGIKYNKYMPTEVFRLPSGLTIYESPFLGADGSRGVVGGPHPFITEIHEQFFGNGASVQFTTYASQQLQVYRMGVIVNPDLLFLDPKDQKDKTQELLLDVESEKREDCCSLSRCKCALVARNKRIFEEVESAGSQITFRCIKCRGCKDCRNSEKIEMISMREEAEQEIITKSVMVNLETCCSTAVLPFTEDPAKKLTSNSDRALKVYKSIVCRLNKDPQSKQKVIEFEKRLQDLKMVEFVWNLTKEQQDNIRSATLQYFFPWRPVFNSNSLSTPWRMVFDASMPTSSGYSLNDVVAKGRNQMNKLVEIFIRWFIRIVAFHTDVSKMYPTLKLRENHWAYQLYYWHPDLDPNEHPVAKVIKTLIYGVKSSGNQAEYALRQTAKLQKMQYPRICNIVHNDIYVDDCISGEDTVEQAIKSSEELEIVLARGGFSLKGFTFSGKPPPAHLTADGESINVAGWKWYPETDVLQYDTEVLKPANKTSGKKPSREALISKLTKADCASKVTGIFDLTGKLAPILAGMKVDLRGLTTIKHLQWKDAIPDNLRGVWKTHLEMMEEIPTLKYHRCVVPEDAMSLDIVTIDTGDASKSISCAAIYARFQRRNGKFSCQLVFARTKLVPDGTTQPRSELLAALLNSHTGEVVRRAFGEFHKKSLKLSDSQIILFWINNEHKALKPWVRTRVIEILRFTLRSQWYYIESKKLIADLGTRRGVKLSDVNANSDWINGYPWMKEDESLFPIKSVGDLTMSVGDSENYKKEVFAPYDNVEDLTSVDWPQTKVLHSNSLPSICSRFKAEDISARYEFSKYLIDPNRRRFSTVVRIMAIVKRFIKNCRIQVQKNRNSSNKERNKVSSTVVNDSCNISEGVVLSDEEIAAGRNYFFKKATAEVKEFAKESDYQKISTEKEGILYYTGRILPEQNIESVVKMTDIMKDLSNTSFFVPIVDAQSPIAYSVINEIHWDHAVANHSGVETVFRYVLQVCYIINGRNLVKLYRKNCERCRYLAKRTIDIAMGPVSSQNLTIAPAFFITQLDLVGPFLSYSPHNKRTTVKVWFAVYCCSTTSTINLKVMEDYSAAGFIQSFIRFSCENGYPKMLVSDVGSQLLKGYDDMKISFTDLQSKLHKDMGVEFDLVPVGGHNMTGKVERKIREVRESISKSFHNRRLSVLQWETVGAEVANTINDMPLALGNVVSDLENMDILTPNRLRLGRNNNRSPVGPMCVTSDPSKFFAENSDIFNCWFECWLTAHVPNMMHCPKWFKTDFHMKVGDVVLFLKKEGLLNDTYQFGIVESVDISRDNKIRSANVKYRNHNEDFDRVTWRTVRQLIVIHRVDELDIVHELGKIATITDMKKKLHTDAQCGCSN